MISVRNKIHKMIYTHDDNNCDKAWERHNIVVCVNDQSQRNSQIIMKLNQFAQMNLFTLFCISCFSY